MEGRHSFEWARMWLDRAESGGLVERFEVIVRRHRESALADHADDLAGGWVEPGYRRPAVTDLVQLRRWHDSRTGKVRCKTVDWLQVGCDVAEVAAVQDELEVRQ